jgi:hypothetical protein
MLERLLPSVAGFEYHGNRLALWLLGLVLALKLAIALGSIFNGHYAASVADGIPIDSYTPQGTQAVVALFGSLGLSQALLCLVGGLVLFRYQALAPALALLLAFEFLARKAVSLALPIVRTSGAPGGAINWVIFGLIVLAFVLALRRHSSPI